MSVLIYGTKNIYPLITLLFTIANITINICLYFMVNYKLLPINDSQILIRKIAK